MSPILSRQAIALQADAAAKNWTAAWLQDSAAPKPANPYDQHVHPDHYRAWAASFERSLVVFSADDVEVSA
jgi:hypothetical protein